MCERRLYVVEQGDYDRSKLKVVQFSMNPYAMAKTKQAGEVERLQKENAKLVSRLKLVEESNNQTITDLTMKAEEMSSATTVKELQGEPGYEVRESKE